MRYSVPILVIFWNRPELLQGLFDILQTLEPARLYLACDGSRSNDPHNQRLVQRCRDLVEQRITWPVQVQRRYADINQGCRAGVAGAISWFFEHEAEGIVLEDDVHPEPSFFPYMRELLERYRGVGGVGGGPGRSTTPASPRGQPFGTRACWRAWATEVSSAIGRAS